MDFSSAFARVVAGVGAAAIAVRRMSGVPSQQAVGPRPEIPGARPQGMLPTLKMPTARGWEAGRTPTPAPGLKVNAFAAGLKHPRWLHVLPNGDVLAAEALQQEQPVHSIFDYAMVATMRRAAALGVSPNRITLLARPRRRRRRRDAPRLSRRPQPALRHGSGRRHVLCRQYRRTRRLPVRARRDEALRPRPQARLVQARRPLDAQPAGDAGRGGDLCRRRLA